MTKAGYVLVGTVAFVVFAVVFAPARAVRLATDRVDGLVLRGIAGTLWRGEADVAYQGFGAGRLAWAFAPLALFGGEVRIHWRLSEDDHELDGIASRGFASMAVSASGQVGAAAVNRMLGIYHIEVGSALTVDELFLRINEGARVANGTLRWSGGRTVYRLSRQTYYADLPEMIAHVDTVAGETRLEASSVPDGAPLLKLRLDREGTVHIGITRRFSVLAGKPWPGTGADDTVVLTLSEKLF